MNEGPISRLIFVFAANSGKLNAIVDSVKKVLMVKGCTLCAITHGLAGEKSEWSECKDTLGVSVDYLHPDELRPPLAELVRDELPCVVAEVGGSLSILLSSEVLEQCRGNVSEFRGRLYRNAAMKGLWFPHIAEGAA